MFFGCGSWIGALFFFLYVVVAGLLFFFVVLFCAVVSSFFSLSSFQLSCGRVSFSVIDSSMLLVRDPFVGVFSRVFLFQCCCWLEFCLFLVCSVLVVRWAICLSP